jgi:hypothetical protein
MAMLELAIVLPLLVMLVFAVVELGLAMARFQIVSNAAREGARSASLYRDGCDPGGVAADVRRTVERYAAGQLGIRAGELRVELSGACTSGESTVRVEFRHRLVTLPGVSGVPAALDLVGRSVMRNET